MPLLSDSSPPITTRVSMRGPFTAVDVQHDAGRRSAAACRRRARPSAGSCRRRRRLIAVPALRVERDVEREGVAFVQHDLAVRRNARCGSSGPADRRARRPTCRPAPPTARTICDALGVRLRLAVREVDAHDVGAGAQHVGQHLGIVGGRAECGQDLGATEHDDRQQRLAVRYAGFRRVASAGRALFQHATAGSFLPSRNSRNAPPPVEM